MARTELNIPTNTKKYATFDGDKARCGNCKSVLGEFKNADGEIKCRKNDCKTLNIIKR